MDQLRHRNAGRHSSYPEAVSWESSSCLRFDERPLESPKSWKPNNSRTQTNYPYEQYLNNLGTHA